MTWRLQCNEISHYLESTHIVDFATTPEILKLSCDIAAQAENEIAFIKAAYEYVRDNIAHSADIQGKTVTCKASEVLSAKEGICYAKAHLLAAVLHANKVPAGFCYQKLILNEDTAPHLVLHGLNAAYIKSLDKWIRLDARGNKKGVNAQFSLNKEQLAFPVRAEKGESDIPIIFAYADTNIVDTLAKYDELDQLWHNLPTCLEGLKDN